MTRSVLGDVVVLGIETSCDETGVGICRRRSDGTVELLADEIASSVELHARFGGVVPEVASRAHLEAMVPTVARAMEIAGVKPSDVDAARRTCRCRSCGRGRSTATARCGL